MDTYLSRLRARQHAFARFVLLVALLALPGWASVADIFKAGVWEGHTAGRRHRTTRLACDQAQGLSRGVVYKQCWQEKGSCITH